VAPVPGDAAAPGQAPAAGATATPEPDSDLGTVTVTAQRRTNTVQKTPIAITAFGEDAIQQKKIADFRDLSGRVPGLTLPLRSTAYTTQTFSIRGIGEIDTYPEPSVALYVDDVYIARSVGSIYDTPDLERVEVLRGPQGTLYGRNSAAGAIRFITKDPKAERTAGLSLTLGNYNNVLIRGRLSGGILPDDKLNASVSVVRHKRRGWTYSVPLAQWVNDLDIWALRAKVKSQITDRFSATLAGDIMFDRSTASYYTPIYQPNGKASTQPTNPDLTWSNTIPLNKTTVYGGSLTFKYALDDNLSLKSVTAVRGMHGPIYYDNDGVTQIKGDSYAGFNENYETQEFTINGDYDKLNFVGGLFYFNEFFHNNRLSQSASGPVDNVGVITHANSYLKTQSYAAFANADYKLTKSLSVTGGLRYTLDHRGFANDGQVATGANLIYPLPGNNDPSQFGSLFTDPTKNFYARPAAKNYSALTPKVGINEQFTDDILVYATYSRGFKSGGYDLRATSLNGSVTPYKPQYTNAYEAGWKSSFFDNHLTANIAAFYNQITDVQVRATSNGALGIPVSSLINAGKAHTYGGELELAANPTRGLTLGSAIAYLKTGYDTFTASLPGNAPARTTLLGLDFPLAPLWQINLNGNYRLPLPTEGSWRIGGDVPIQTRYFTDIYNTSQTQVKAQAFVNGTFNYTPKDEGWSAGVQVSNLLNTRRRQTGGYSPANAGADPYWYAGYNPPRFINFFINIGKI
jgi:iron complex outermembrane recepter protein